MEVIFPKLRNRITIVVVFILLIPALWYHIDLLAFNDDEAIRALVALEMDLRSNYIVATLNDSYYFAKPPLYNWILGSFCNILGGYTELYARSLTILFLLLFGALIFHFSKAYFQKRYALINALFFLTCGRIFFWDSLLAYIDIAYSMICYLSFMLIYKFHKEKKYASLFIFSYGLMAIGFLMKGFPSIVFQGVTLFVLFNFFDRWRNVFSIKHLYGVITAGLVLGSYYWTYHQYLPFDSGFDTLLDQSTRRTLFEKGISKTLKFIVEFPFRYIYHFLPWSLMLILVFRIRHMSRLLTNPFLKYCWYVFLFNVIIYWISPGTIPRYVLMLIPLLFTVLLALYSYHKENKSLEIRILDMLYFVSIIGSIGFVLSPLFMDRFEDYSLRYLICISMAAGLSYLAYRFYIRPENRLLTYVLCIVILRLGLNIFYLPEKAKESRLNHCKNEALRIADTYRDYPLTLDKSTLVGNLASFYITNERQEIFPRVQTIPNEDTLIVINSERFRSMSAIEKVDSFSVCELPSLMILAKSKSR